MRTDDGSLSLRHPEHGEVYHSQLGADAEARLLYVEASGIRARFASGRPTAVLDVGLGLAYNAVHTLRAWRDGGASAPLAIVSLEIDAELVRALASGTAPWQENWDAASRGWTAALRHVAGPHWAAAIDGGGGAICTWTVLVGDAAALLALPRPPAPHAGYDFVWQDPFSPQKSPPLWTPAWFAKVRAVVAPDASLLTYSVAGAVRNALSAAGFAPERFAAAPGHKRQWLRARPS